MNTLTLTVLIPACLAAYYAMCDDRKRAWDAIETSVLVLIIGGFLAPALYMWVMGYPQLGVEGNLEFMIERFEEWDS